MEAAYLHEPVLLEETIGNLLGPTSGVYVDGTVGAGGHAEQLLLRRPGVRLFGFDRDAEALALAHRRLAPFGDRVTLVHDDFRRMGATLKKTASGESPGSCSTWVALRCSSWTPAAASPSRRTDRWT